MDNALEYEEGRIVREASKKGYFCQKNKPQHNQTMLTLLKAMSFGIC
jgi:hypothetical protein